MRGGREEDGKVVSPMFPRLHVNDAGKGGPRAPPRNKMALYEQLSIPSQRIKHAAVPTFPVSSGNSAAAVPSASSSQGYGHENSMHPSYYSSPQMPSHSIEKAHLSSDGRNSSSSRLELDRRSAKHVSCGSVNAPVHLRSVAHDLTSSWNSSRKECEDDDDFRVPTFVQSDKDQHVSEGRSVQAESPKRSAMANYNSAIGLPKANGNPPEHAVITDSKSKKHERSDSQQIPKENVSPKVQKQKPTSHVGSGEKNCHALNIQKASCNQGNAKVVLNNHKTLHNGGKKLHQGSICTGNWGASRCSTDTEDAEKGGLPTAKVESASKTSNTNYPRSLNQAEDYSENDDKISGSLDNGDMEKNDDVSDTSMVDSDSGFDISPDDVVSVIGPKHFWKARRAIVNQQRAFAVQVFELHRLIKVQKLIAASPDLLLEGNPYLRKSSIVRTNINSSEQNVKSQPESAKRKDDPHKTNNSVYSSENTPRALPLPSQEDSFDRSHVSEVPQSEPYPGNTTPVSKASENRPNPQCFHPQGNQWLVPVMSPLEGLVYKPYTGPCPPPVGFMAPVFAGYGPMAMPPVGNFMNATYGVPASHQQQNFGIIPGNPAVVPHYFPAPYGLPVANPTTPGSDVEQTKFPTGIQSNGIVEQQSCNSCDTLDPRSETFSGSAQKIQASKDSELDGSSESSPNDRVLPFFPVVSVAEGSDQPVRNHHRDRQTRVIKVVPHNAMTATESAARIFRCIQNERLQYD